MFYFLEFTVFCKTLKTSPKTLFSPSFVLSLWLGTQQQGHMSHMDLQGISLDIRDSWNHFISWTLQNQSGVKMCFKNNISGVIFANPSCFGNWRVWRNYLHDSWVFKSRYLNSFTLYTRCQDDVMCPSVWYVSGRACLLQERRMATWKKCAEVPTEIPMSYSTWAGLGWGSFSKK